MLSNGQIRITQVEDGIDQTTKLANITDMIEITSHGQTITIAISSEGMTVVTPNEELTHNW